MSLVLRYAARSDRGLIRGNNQDSVYAGPRLLAVADGMGGHAAGDVASKVVIAALEHLDDDAPSGDMLQSMREAVFEGSEHLREVIRESPQLEGMGTTLTAILFAGGRLALCHVGDSRAYLLRDGQLTQITHDDTFVQTLIDDGRITPEEANSHPQRSLLLRALNGQDVDPDLSMREARAGDRYLLCSDGLSGVVSEETLAEALLDPDPQSTADRLIELALRSGGPDNVTVIVADVDRGRRPRRRPHRARHRRRRRRQRRPAAGRRPVGRRARGPGRSAAAPAAPDDTAAGRWPLRPPPPAAPHPRGGSRSRRARGGGDRYLRLGPAALVRRGRGHRAATSTSPSSAGWTSRSSASTCIEVEESTDLAVGDLTHAARSRVRGGITADDEADAARILDALRDQRLPVCPSGGTGKAGGDDGATQQRALVLRVAVHAAPRRHRRRPPTTAPSRTPGSTTPTTSTPARTTSSSEPGVDCREAK